VVPEKEILNFPAFVIHFVRDFQSVDAPGRIVKISTPPSSNMTLAMVVSLLSGVFNHG
jgi:hypothetical protein